MVKQKLKKIQSLSFCVQLRLKNIDLCAGIYSLIVITQKRRKERERERQTDRQTDRQTEHSETERLSVYIGVGGGG